MPEDILHRKRLPELIPHLSSHSQLIAALTPTFTQNAVRPPCTLKCCFLQNSQ